MKFVIDTNRLMAAILKDSSTRKIIYSKNLNFITPEDAGRELIHFNPYISKKTGLEISEVKTLFSQIMSYVEIVPKTKIQPFMKEADETMKGIDLNDSVFVASALAVKSEGIFSHDTHFEKQNKVKVWKNKDLIKFL